MASLSADLFYDILRRLDGAALARAGCACADFSSISREEALWENACRSRWPSTRREDVRCLISSTGGFRKFYADCFTLILNKDVPAAQCSETNPFAQELAECDYYYDDDDTDELEDASPSDFVSLIDVWYKERPIYSKVLWGIPDTNGASHGWFYNCPFRINLCDQSPENEMNNAGEVFLSTVTGLPPVPSMERERKDGKLWKELTDGVKLSWIIVNRKTKRAVNLASWSPLGGQRHWPTDGEFVLRFGSVLPAKDVLPCRVAECILLMKFQVSGIGGETLGMTELGMQIEDVRGGRLNGRRSLLVLKAALSCHRSNNYGEVLESCHSYSRAQSELKEERMRSESRFDTLCVITGIAVFAALCRMLYKKLEGF